MKKQKFNRMYKRQLPKEFIESLECSVLPIHLIESIYNMLQRSARNSDSSVCVGQFVLPKQKESTIHDTAHGHNRTSLVNNDQIVIQIPKGIKVSSIQIQFDQEKPDHLHRSLSSKF